MTFWLNWKHSQIGVGLLLNGKIFELVCGKHIHRYA